VRGFEKTYPRSAVCLTGTILTIGLCVKNAERTIKHSVDSLIYQDYPRENMEILIVDGRSEDRTLEIVKSMMAATNTRYRVYSDEGKGLGLARQIVVDKACGKYILYIGSDVILPRDFLRKQLDFIERNQNVGAAIPRSEYAKSEGNIVADVQSLLLSSAKNISNGTLFRKRALDEINGFDAKIIGASEDRDVLLRLRFAGWKAAENPLATFCQIRDERLKDVYLRGFWYGYGDHFTHHKHRSAIKTPYWLPPTYVLWGIKISFRAHSKYGEKKSFLIPLLCLFSSIGWCLGFVKAHLVEYGHKIEDN
jgi:glycosyltransferase involved in cell wall biosynthesis